jgi:hypothetical protein
MNDEKKENELSKTESQPLTIKPKIDLPDSIEDFDIEDLQLSNYFICQDQSNKARDGGVEPGMIYDPNTFKSYTELELIIFFHFKTRIHYGPEIGDPLVCYSQDNKYPAHPTPINANCATCPENIRPVEDIKKGESKYGKCNKTFNFACILPDLEAGNELDFPFIISMQRTNAKTAKNILNQVIKKRQQLYTIMKKVSAFQVVTEKFRYYNFKVEDGGATSVEDIERSNYWLQFMKMMKDAKRLTIDIEGDEGEKIVNNDSDIPF